MGRCLLGHHGVIEAVVSEAWVRVDTGVGEAGVFVAEKSKYSLVHLFGVEDLQAHQKVEVLDGEAGDGEEQVGLQLGDHVLEGGGRPPGRLLP